MIFRKLNVLVLDKYILRIFQHFIKFIQFFERLIQLGAQFYYINSLNKGFRKNISTF